MAGNRRLEDQQRKAMEELKERMKGDMEQELYDDDYLFHRFLRARDHNVDNAENMLRKHLEWRKKHDVKNVLKWKMPEIFEKYGPYILLGYDKEGCPIRYIPIGNIDISGILASCRLEDVTKVIVYYFEEETELLKKQSKKLGRNVEQCVYIINIDHLKLKNATNKKCFPFYIFTLDLIQNNYPERLKAAYFLNMSYISLMVFHMIKKFIASATLRKVTFYSDESYKDDLLKVIDADILPAFLGGNRTDPDGNPLCLSFINHGNMVPESYYMSNSKERFKNDPTFHKLLLRRRTSHRLYVQVPEEGYLDWEFQINGYDIGFGVYYEDIEDYMKMKKLIPLHRVKTEDYTETGACKCDKPGSYIIIFDNSHSWFRSKEVFYKIKAVSSEEYESTLVAQDN